MHDSIFLLLALREAPSAGTLIGGNYTTQHHTQITVSLADASLAVTGLQTGSSVLEMAALVYSEQRVPGVSERAPLKMIVTTHYEDVPLAGSPMRTFVAVPQA